MKSKARPLQVIYCPKAGDAYMTTGEMDKEGQLLKVENKSYQPMPGHSFQFRRRTTYLVHEESATTVDPRGNKTKISPEFLDEVANNNYTSQVHGSLRKEKDGLLKEAAPWILGGLLVLSIVLGFYNSSQLSGQLKESNAEIQTLTHVLTPTVGTQRSGPSENVTLSPPARSGGG